MLVAQPLWNTTNRHLQATSSGGTMSTPATHNKDRTGEKRRRLDSPPSSGLAEVAPAAPGYPSPQPRVYESKPRRSPRSSGHRNRCPDGFKTESRPPGGRLIEGRLCGGQTEAHHQRQQRQNEAESTAQKTGRNLCVMGRMDAGELDYSGASNVATRYLETLKAMSGSLDDIVLPRRLQVSAVKHNPSIHFAEDVVDTICCASP